MDTFMHAEFWIAVGQIIMIDILLGGDNAVVIALACRKLPPAQRTKGIIWGTMGAIVLRVVLIFFALTLLAIPYLKIVGALLLVWIGVKLIAPDEEGDHGDIQASDRLWAAVKTVIIADLVMSVDNVIAIAGAAESAGGSHKMPLVIFGLLVSIPIIVWGSQLVIKLMDRFPMIITVGGMLLGWIAGTMAVTDPAVLGHLPTLPAERAGALPEVVASLRYGAGVAGALLVLAAGMVVKRLRKPPVVPHCLNAAPVDGDVLTAGAAVARYGNYRVLRALGQGAMGTVYLAVDERTDAPVALKLLPLGSGLYADEMDDARDRFLAETAGARALSHPDIVAILDAGEAGGFGWMALELVAGGDLGRYTSRSRLLPEPLVLRIGVRMARALHFAHRAGVVHRDVKPANIMVDWGLDHIKLADFGLARLADAARTRTGVVLGSPAYMAPELLAGAVPTAASDLYALGVTLFQLLSGRLPYAGDSMGELLRQVAAEPPLDLRRLRSELPVELCQAVACLLAKRPADRTADGERLAQQLELLRAQVT